MSADARNMNTLSFEDYVSDILGLNAGLMSDAELRDARQSYAVWVSSSDDRRRWKAGEKVLADRAVAALFGGKALTGTPKQKTWAEKIRAQKLRGERSKYCAYTRYEMTDSQAVMACDPNGLGRSAHFWIHNRDRRPDEIGRFFETQKRMLAEARALREAGKIDEFKAIAEQYNKLTEEWGFTK